MLGAAPLAVLLGAAPLSAQSAPEAPRRSFTDRLWVAFGLGGGQVQRWSDQAARVHSTTVTGSLRFGVILSPAVRVGLEANGWGVETSDLNDPSRGRTVNELLVIAQWYPRRPAGLYLKGGYGWGSYGTNAAGEWGSSALGAVAVGAGWELRVWRHGAFTLAADWARGPLGSVDNQVQTETGRRFRGWDVIVGAQWH